MISQVMRVGGAVTATVVAAVVLAACSSGDGPTGGGGSTAPDPSRCGCANPGALHVAMSLVQDNASTRAQVQFGRPEEALAANHGKLAGGQYGEAVGYGLGPLMDVLGRSPNVLGLDPRRAVFAITAGAGLRTQGTLVFGQRPAVAPAKLVALGARRSGSTFRFAPDNAMMTTGRLAHALPGFVGFNVVRVDGDYERFGANSASITETQQATGSGLLGYPPMAAVASCLGNPLAADIVNKPPSVNRLLPRDAPRPPPTLGVQMVGVGLSDAEAGPPIEQLCVSEDSVQHADQLAAAIREAVHHGLSMAENRPWKTLLTAASVHVQGSTVSLTARPGQGSGGILLQALTQGDLPGVIG